jgi:hypothetical protein
MAEYNFQLRGWHAVVGIAALLGFFGIQMALHVRPVDDGIRNAVRKRLLDEYSGRGPKDVARVAESRAGLPIEPCLRSPSGTSRLPRLLRTAGWAQG